MIINILIDEYENIENINLSKIVYDICNVYHMIKLYIHYINPNIIKIII